MRGNRRLPGLFLAVAVMILGMIGCGKLTNTDIKITKGLAKNELFRVGKEVCTKEEALIFVTSQKNVYEAAYSDQIWDISLNGGTFESYVKNSLLNFLAKEKCMVAMAKEHEMSTTGEEEQKIKEAAEKYCSALSGEEQEATGITTEIAEKVFREYYLSNKLLESLTKDVNVEISDNDARVIHVQQIFLKDKTEDNKALAEKLVAKLADGADFTGLADSYSDSDTVDVARTRGEYPQEVDTAAFALSDGEISSVIEAADGYYILKCTEDYDEAATNEHKKQMEADLKEEAFTQLYDTFTSGLSAEYNDKAWEELSYQGPGVSAEANFYEIYADYFKEEK